MKFNPNMYYELRSFPVDLVVSLQTEILGSDGGGGDDVLLR
jgi:hypothetical protein